MRVYDVHFIATGWVRIAAQDKDEAFDQAAGVILGSLDDMTVRHDGIEVECDEFCYVDPPAPEGGD